ncbi:hypothetical protein NC652_032712 [Populus alba x Populus x berolinensis]|nr:hypothetical protein NC652_032712 [Populus alba x Populus x berolinensis]
MIGNHVDDDDDDDDKEERKGAGAGAGHAMIGNHVDPKQRHSHQHQCICIPRNQESPLRHALTAPLTSLLQEDQQLLPCFSLETSFERLKEGCAKNRLIIV